MTDSLEVRALVTLLRESLCRAEDKNDFLLNPGDPGLLDAFPDHTAYHLGAIRQILLAPAKS